MALMISEWYIFMAKTFETHYCKQLPLKCVHLMKYVAINITYFFFINKKTLTHKCTLK